ncbi:hypothetical protein ABZ705_15590 [Streptomyces sp. NPDC006984]|uniref:hypothetical protein n=1 Tax=Streptomyces sp. NPDC006984 TaxID=3155463 RepID=UPI0033CE51C5
MPALAEERVLAVRTARHRLTRLYGLLPGYIEARLLCGSVVTMAFADCEDCGWQQAVAPEHRTRRHGHPCQPPARTAAPPGATPVRAGGPSRRARGTCTP